MSLSHFNETMTKEQIATEFRRSMVALEECIDGLDSPKLDLEKETKRLDERIDRLYLLAFIAFVMAVTALALIWKALP